MIRPLSVLSILLLAGRAFAQNPASASAPATPAPYWSVSDLRADVAAVGPDPFAWAPPGRTAAPARPAGEVPSNVAHLSLRRPYTVTFEGVEPSPVLRLSLTPHNPFDPPAPPAQLPAVPKEAAADFYQPWLVTLNATAWEALADAWNKDAVAVRKAFREAMKQDWPVTTAHGPRAEASRLAAARWVRQTWDASVRHDVADGKRGLGLRGPVIVTGPIDASLSFLGAGDAANHPSPKLRPRVTGDAAVNRYGPGFLVRLTADLGQRIPWPALDLSKITPDDLPWVTLWLDETIRNGVQGLSITPPEDEAARERLQELLVSLNRPNVFLPPPSEVGILVSRNTATLEPGAWVAVFRAYATLRGAGAWPDFVSDEQVTDGTVALARFKVLVIPAAAWADRGLLREISSWVERGGVAVISDPSAFSRATDGWDTSTQARAFLGTFGAERTLGSGSVITLAQPIEPGTDTALWPGLLRRAGVVSRPWLENVTLASVRRISGTYSRPPALK